MAGIFLEAPVPPLVAELVAAALLLGVLGFAVLRPRHLPEAAAALPAAGLLVAVGAVSAGAAYREVAELAPTVGFLAAMLVLAHLCDEEGVFAAAGALMARASGGRPRSLLTMVFAVAAVITAVLSLDATVVLLTPVVFVTAAALRVRARPHVYACTHLANSASLLLPVSNLTNLLAFGASGLSFGRFATLMGLPWLVVIAVEYAVFRWFFAPDLTLDLAPDPTPALAADPAVAEPADTGDAPTNPGFAVAVVALTLAGFAVSSLVGIEPAWVAGAGALVLAVRRLARGGTDLATLVRAASVPFLVFVLALGVIVAAVERNGLGDVVGGLLPDTPSIAGLLAVAAVAAVLANLVNNLPAILILLPALTRHHHPGLVLAALIGVNVGPNLTYVGSLATLLWRRILRSREVEPPLSEFLRLGALTVPPALALGVLALWAALTALG